MAGKIEAALDALERGGGLAIAPFSELGPNNAVEKLASFGETGGTSIKARRWRRPQRFNPGGPFGNTKSLKNSGGGDVDGGSGR